MPEIPVILVNEHREDENGDDFSHAPTPETLAAGYVESRPVILQYPDGRRESAEQVLITAKGVEEMRRGMEIDAGSRH